jgi:hypothetical protein
MRFLMLICEDAETMDDPTEHDPTDPDDKELFAWLGRRSGAGHPGRRQPAGSVPPGSLRPRP